MFSYEAIRLRRDAEKNLRNKRAEARKKAEEIAAHPETKIITKADIPAPWEYIENLYPRISSAIAQTKIFKNENTAFCKNVGIPPEAGGVFLVQACTIVICWTNDKFKDDVVICHEMLHYTSQLLGGHMVSRAFEEDFAYGKSVKYLTDHGYSKQWICEEYMLPYYWSMDISRSQRRLRRQLNSIEKEEARQRAMIKCNDIIDLEMKGGVWYPWPNDEPDRFDLI